MKQTRISNPIFGRKKTSNRSLWKSALLLATILFVWQCPLIVHAAPLDTVTGSFTSTNGDDAHNFKELEGKLDVVLPQLYQQGHNPKITSITTTIQNQSGTFTTTYKAVIEESSDGKAWMGFTARGSFGNTPSAQCPPDPLKKNYQIRASGQITGCENADGRSLEAKLKSDPAILAGEVYILAYYDNPAIPVREYFVIFTKPAAYPPLSGGQRPVTPQQNNNQGTGASGTNVTNQGQQANQTFTPTGNAADAKGTCSDGIDNDGDGAIDWNGATSADGVTAYPSDTSCISATSTEVADDVAAGSLVPCTNKCDLNSVFALLNNLITFLIKVILFPICILMIVYVGFKYITSSGNPGAHALAKKMARNLFFGMVLILCSWVIVKTALGVIGYSDGLYFFQ